MADKTRRTTLFFVFLLSLFLALVPTSSHRPKLRFGRNGEFKILQVADMHFANGATTRCLDVLPTQKAHCSDLNTTVFMTRVIAAEKPDLIVFTGKNPNSK